MALKKLKKFGVQMSTQIEDMERVITKQREANLMLEEVTDEIRFLLPTMTVEERKFVSDQAMLMQEQIRTIKANLNKIYGR